MVIKEISGKTAIIKLNRPEKRNSLHPDMVLELIEIFGELNESPDISAVILTGEGTSFCAGADLAYLQQLSSFSNNENYADSELLSRLFYGIYSMNKLTIAAVNGPAIAGGCGLVTSVDYVIANDSQAKFGYTEVKIGFLPAIVSALLIKRVGEAKARQLLIGGNILTAADAEKIGLADVLDVNPLEAAIGFAKSLENNSAESIAETKKLIRTVSGMGMEEAISYCVSLNVVGRRTDDFKTGIENFLRRK